ncbi:MAG: penicillin-binding transpeptidase domain-containing protein, partial [Verrucomicrobiota bacterium]
SSYERGSFNVCEAIRRSNNVWFYKAALDTGGKPILKTARNFGIGSGPKIGLEGVASGTIAEAIYAERALANFSIGQGNLLTSPLQMTLAYCALANGKYLPVPRLIGQIQAPPPSEAVLQRFPPRQAFAFDFSRSQMQAIQQGLREVVNHRSGTGTRAKLHRPTISGKTGTAQWTPKDGKERWVVWFSGYVLGNPKLVFTVMCESQPGEQIFGGEVAAPLAASFLQTVYDDPNRFRLRSIPSKDPRPLASVESSPMGQIALHRN